jgi:orotate phosphoribosyltransferase
MATTVHVQEQTAASVASMLLEIQAIKLNTEKPFTWASGWKSPIYCDNRLSLSFPAIRTAIRDGLVQAIRAKFPSAEAVAGVATAGVPQGALVADVLQLPFVYVRPKPKDHGMENLIEGKVVKGQRVVVIEDLISTGGSSLKAVQALRDAGFDVLGMVSIFTYGFEVAVSNFREANVPLVSLSDYSSLIAYASAHNLISPDQITSLKAWRVDPANWRAIP